jgi:hypothetical protein
MNCATCCGVCRDAGCDIRCSIGCHSLCDISDATLRRLVQRELLRSPALACAWEIPVAHLPIAVHKVDHWHP